MSLFLISVVKFMQISLLIHDIGYKKQNRLILKCPLYPSFTVRVSECGRVYNKESGGRVVLA